MRAQEQGYGRERSRSGRWSKYIGEEGVGAVIDEMKQKRVQKQGYRRGRSRSWHRTKVIGYVR